MRSWITCAKWSACGEVERCGEKRSQRARETSVGEWWGLRNHADAVAQRGITAKARNAKEWTPLPSEGLRTGGTHGEGAGRGVDARVGRRGVDVS